MALALVQRPGAEENGEERETGCRPEGDDGVLLGAAARPLIGGHYATLFWGGLIGLGLVVPLVLDLVGSRVRSLGAVAAVLVLIGGFVLRYVVLMSVQA